MLSDHIFILIQSILTLPFAQGPTYLGIHVDNSAGSDK